MNKFFLNLEDSQEGEEKEIEGSLIIDKILNETDGAQPSPLSLTARVMEQRKAVIKETEQILKDKIEEESEDTGSSDEEVEEEAEESEPTVSKEEEEDVDFNTEDPFDEDENSKKKKDKEKEDEKEVEDSKDEPTDKKEESKEESIENLGKESADEVSNIKSKIDIFGSLRNNIRNSEKYLRSINLSVENNTSEVAVAYNKEAISESLHFLSKINTKYEFNTNKYIETLQKSLLRMDTRISNFKRVFETDSIKFTNKLIDDVELLSKIAIVKNTSLRASFKVIKAYVTDANIISTLILKSPFNNLKDSFASKGFIDKGEVLQYSKILPGNVTVKVGLPEYKNFVKTNVTSYQFFYINSNNISDVYELVPISITEEKDVKYYTNTLQELILESVVSLDILKVLNSNFAKYADELKVLSVEVEEDKYEKLAELGLDEKIHDFIKFKVAVEIATSNIDIVFNYITCVIRIMEICIELNDVK